MSKPHWLVGPLIFSLQASAYRFTFGHQPGYDHAMIALVSDKKDAPEGFVTIPFQDVYVHYDPEVFEEEEILTMISECENGDCSSLRVNCVFDTPRTRG